MDIKLSSRGFRRLSAGVVLAATALLLGGCFPIGGGHGGPPGTAMLDVAAASPSGDFGTQTVGTPAVRGIEIINEGTAPTGSLVTTLTGSSTPAGFTIDPSGCSASLAVNATCTVQVTFDPMVAATSYQASLIVQDGTAGSSVSILLLGTTP